MTSRAAGLFGESAFRRMCLAAATVLAMTPVLGHHSLTEYDTAKRITIDALVQEHQAELLAAEDA